MRLIRSLIKEKSNKNFVYHLTIKNRVNSILEEGLKVNQENGLTLGGAYWDDFYKMRPIYVATDIKVLDSYIKGYKEDFHGILLTILKIDYDIDKLISDIPTLVSPPFRFYLNDGGRDGFFKRLGNRYIEKIEKYIDNKYENLEEPNVGIEGNSVNIYSTKVFKDLEFSKIMVEMTKTGVILENIENIPKGRISIYKEIK